MTTPSVLITRPEPEAGETAQRMEHYGYRTAHSPILNIRSLKYDNNDLFSIYTTNIQAIALTSTHALSVPESWRELPLAVVGAASETKARIQGFADIRTAAGNAAALAELIAASFSPDAGAILYPRGRHTAFDLAGALRSRGFDVREIVTYEAVPIEELPVPVISLLKEKNIHAISVYSARALLTLEQLIRKHGLEDATMHINLVCFSAKIAKEATCDLWQKIVHADTPEEAAMLEAFKRLYGEPPRITTGA